MDESVELCIDTATPGMPYQEATVGYDAHMLAVDTCWAGLSFWRQARRRVDALRKARGFTPVRNIAEG